MRSHTLRSATLRISPDRYALNLTGATNESCSRTWRRPACVARMDSPASSERHRIRGGSHGDALCGHSPRRRTPPAGREWSWTRGEWAWSRLQPDTALGLDGHKSGHFTVPTAGFAHGPGAGGAGTAAPLRKVRPTDRAADRCERPRRHPQRNDHAAAFQGRGEDAVWSEARVVRHSRCRQPS